MQVKLYINGEDHRIILKPETEADIQILKVVAPHNRFAMKVNKKKPDYGYTDMSVREIESIEIGMADEPVMCEEELLPDIE